LIEPDAVSHIGRGGKAVQSPYIVATTVLVPEIHLGKQEAFYML
jgi:hypothetical protein